MTIVRQYTIHAKDGHEAEVREALRALAESVRTTDACRGVELLHEIGNPSRFVLTERWESEEAHKSANNPKAHALLMEIMPLFDGPPEGAYCAILKTI